MDKIGSLIVEKKCGTDNDDISFGGFKKVVDGYKNGLISQRDIYDEYNFINNHAYRDNIHSKNNKLIASRYIEILSLISNNIIGLDEQKILDSISDTNKNLYYKDYITKDNYDNIILSRYAGLLTKYINVYEKDPLKLRINDINEKIKNIYNAENIFSKSGTDDEEDVKMLERTRELYYALNKIYNPVENKIYDRDIKEGHKEKGYDKEGYDRGGYDRQGYDRQGITKKQYDEYMKQKKQGKGLKIITPKQMLSRLQVLLAQIHAGNNSSKLKNEIRQLLYSLYRSKKISKTVYNNLIATM